MTYEIVKTSRFKKDFKRALKRGCSPDKFAYILNRLVHDQPLEAKHRDHALSGDFEGFRECHITPDWLLIYCIEQDVLVLTLIRTGTHSDLF